MNPKADKLSTLWDRLTTSQREWLIIRWGGNCNSDRQAVRIMEQRITQRHKASLTGGGPEGLHEENSISFVAIYQWKKQPSFREAYQNCQDRLLFATVIAREGIINQLQPVLREMEIIINKPWEDCGGGENASKSKVIALVLQQLGPTGKQPTPMRSRSGRGNILARISEGEAEP